MNGGLDKVGHQGRYEIKKKLGQGASGNVYLALDTSLQVHVALKILNATRKAEQMERFKREVILARKLAHPGICRIFDWNENDSMQFITMEYVEGQSLGAIIEEEGMLDVFRACRLVRAISRGLEAAHHQGIVHRDLKPGNIIVTARDRPVILDFGMALGAGLSRLTDPGTILGTLPYMAPEVLRGEPATPSSDLFSLGVILYRCVTGRLPFPATTNPLDLVEAYETARPMPPIQLNPAVSVELDILVMQILACNCADRPKGASILNAALKSLIVDSSNPDDPSSALWHEDIEQTVSIILSDANASALIQQCIRATTVFFSDIAGITSFFDRHGDIRGRKRILLHNELLFPLVKQFNGTVIKTIGDAIMAVFPEADDAVHCAIAMQKTLAAHNGRHTEEEPILIRIGIHYGTAVVEKKDVFGDTVNVAARICSKTEPEQILISEPTQAHLKSIDAGLQFQESVSLKGKQAQFSLYEVLWAGHSKRTAVPKLPPVPMVLEHSSSDPFGPPVTSHREPQLAIMDESQDGGVRRHSSGPLWALGGAVIALSIAAGGVFLAENDLPPQHDPMSSIAAQPTAAAPIQSLVEKQPPDPTVAAPSVKTKTPEPKIFAPSGEQELATLKGVAEKKMKAKGLEWSDIPDAASSQTRVREFCRSKQWSRAKREEQKIIAIIDELVVDRDLVMDKLNRVNARFDKAKPGTGRERAQQLVDEAVGLLTQGNYLAANKNLRAASQLLR